MSKGLCTLCGYFGETCGIEKQPNIRTCLNCYIRFYCEHQQVGDGEQKEDNLSWQDVDGKSGGKNPDVVDIAPNTTKLVHVLLPDNEEPVSYWTHYIPGKTVNGPKGKVVICPGKNICPACAVGLYRTKRVHAINVWDYEMKAVKILEGGNSIFQPLKQIKDQIGTLQTVDISIKKMGSGKDTSYSVIPIPMMQPFDKSLVHGLFPIGNLRVPNTVEEVSRAIDDMGGIAPGPECISVPFSLPTVEPASTVTTTAPLLQFGKYKGRTVEDVYKEDPNYIRWCADNISDPTIKAEAKRVISQPITTKPTAPGVRFSDETEKQLLVNEINEIFQEDTRYKGNFALILEKMKAASISALHPNGKTMLSEYELPELQILAESIK